MSDYTERIAALVRCFTCGALFPCDPETVPSVYIDPITNCPPDTLPADEIEAATERARRQPLCPPCVSRINKRRAANGMPLIRTIWKG